MLGLTRLTGARRLIRSWAEPSYRHLSRPCLAFGLLTHTLMSQVGYPTRHRPKEAGSLTLDQEIEGSNPSRPANSFHALAIPPILMSRPVSFAHHGCSPCGDRCSSGPLNGLHAAL